MAETLKYSIVGFLLGALLWGLPALASDPFALDQAHREFEKGAYDKALQIYDELAKQSPNDPQLAFNRGDTLYKLKRYDEAFLAFKKSLESAPPDLRRQVLYNMANTLAQNGKLEESLKYYDEALALATDYENAKFNRDLVSKLLEQQKQQKQDTSTQSDTSQGTDTQTSQGSESDTGSATDSGTDTGKDEQNTQNGQDQQGSDTAEAPSTMDEISASSDSSVATSTNAQTWIDNLDDKASETMKYMIKKQLKGKPRQLEKNW